MLPSFVHFQFFLLLLRGLSLLLLACMDGIEHHRLLFLVGLTAPVICIIRIYNTTGTQKPVESDWQMNFQVRCLYVGGRGEGSRAGVSATENTAKPGTWITMKVVTDSPENLPVHQEGGGEAV